MHIFAPLLFPVAKDLVVGRTANVSSVFLFAEKTILTGTTKYFSRRYYALVYYVLKRD